MVAAAAGVDLAEEEEEESSRPPLNLVASVAAGVFHCYWKVGKELEGAPFEQEEEEDKDWPVAATAALAAAERSRLGRKGPPRGRQCAGA